MLTFLRAQTAAFLATVVDFTVTLVLGKLFGVWYITATVIGSISGGVTNFLLGRGWVFDDAEKGIVYMQAIKYILVWIGSIALNTAGVYLFTHFAGFDYMYSKIIASVIVAFGYNYLLQKRYVFR